MLQTSHPVTATRRTSESEALYYSRPAYEYVAAIDFNLAGGVHLQSDRQYVATTPDGRYLLVTNWCGYDLSVVDRATSREVRRIPLGPYPRATAATPDSPTPDHPVMGPSNVRSIHLTTAAASRGSGRGLRPFDDTNEAYKLGVNYLIYGLTH